ncbi:YrrS family protein [Bacillus rubiinfantis]|uniref:YrrS family protein n=1 Tax=Bacillus rubiinfantis TaxID=1499680 RepID=UPI0005A82616|nr:YrrS family protein [Bacillus rubiinfantis]
MSQETNQFSRSGYRAKRKKTNLILNSLIIIVLALIIFVAYNIFASGNDENTPATQEKTKTEQKQTAVKQTQTDDSIKQEESAKEEESQEASGQQEDGSSQDVDQEGTATEKADETQAVISDGGSSSNVVRTIENPAWKPVGTSQTGEHAPVYDSSSVDWQEMLNAISYATGLDQSNMTVWFLGRDRSTTNASVGTVSSKDKQQKYKVYIKWVDGQGWMPTKVEELAEINR